ncbi:L-asparaginase [Actinokineospora alba]|uniref:L-asparaginase n=1 Tax=Actinokineospora alba TaxID=504798 RepID=A0A1H0RX96_9PSEU|nr:asparaginase [Actinokineospora alba]TDP66871.1 L-asparaginase [Actinokineospora alba]SDI47802.1 L-asparaginase [Actinokineospora alba]SDP34202.1 L-asparaginase [Actinokineospora alba]
MSTVVVFGLGGTIAMTADSGGGVVPALSVEQLVAAVPGLAESGIDVEVEDFRRVPGASLSFDDLDALAAAIERRLDGGADGVVVTQGTDTIEETAYFLDLVHTRAEPVVVTGAMRNPTLAGADGPANLFAAIRAAASPRTRDLGALVVFADEIHAACRVRKTHSTSGGTFQSPNGGALGYVVEGEARILNRPVRSRPSQVEGPSRRPTVALVTMTLGDDGAVLDAIADRVDGLVVAAFGVGHVPSGVVDRLGEVAARVPVVLASRTGSGPVLTETYAFPGSESDLLGRGLISAGFLDPLKARILLHHLLSRGASLAGVRDVFAEV